MPRTRLQLENAFKLKDLVIWFPALYALMTFFGYVTYHATYAPFGINIASYLTMTELLLAFISVLMPFFGLMIIAALLALINFFTSTSNGKGIFDQYISDTGRSVERDASLLSMILMFVTVAGIPLLVLWYVFFGDDRISSPMLAFLLAIWVVLSEITLVVMTNTFSTNSTRFRFGMYLLVFTGYIASGNSSRSNALVRDNWKQSFRIITTQDTITDREGVVFVGHVNAGIFLYDRRDSTSILIPSGDVRRFTLRDEQQRKKRKKTYPRPRP